MKKIYVVFECNSQRSYDSYTIKLLSTNRELADRLYCRIRKEYQDGEWYANLAEYYPNPDTDTDANIFNELEILKTSENEVEETNEETENGIYD